MVIQPGDVLGYRGKGVFAWVIRLKTWAPPPGITHVELANSPSSTFASRDGIGVRTFAFRREGLAIIWRPVIPLDMDAVRAFHTRCIGQKYDWWGLLRFFTLGKQSLDKQFCSEYVTRLLRAGGCDPFAPGTDADLIAPWQFAMSPHLREVWRSPASDRPSDGSPED